MERVRWHYATSAHGGEEPVINNDYTSRLARKLMAEQPEQFKDFFELRELKAQ